MIKEAQGVPMQPPSTHTNAARGSVQSSIINDNRMTQGSNALNKLQPSVYMSHDSYSNEILCNDANDPIPDINSQDRDLNFDQDPESCQ